MTTMVPEGASKTLVTGNNLGYRQGDRWLVRGVDIALERGEIVTLIGPNGSGKTTTAKLLTGVLSASEGTLTRLPGLRIGYVPQKVAVDRTMPMTVERLMVLTSPAGQNDIQEALEAVAITHLAKASIHELSGGEFQRALMARALVRKPDLLVLDEPVQGVDINAEIAVYQLIRDIRDRLNCGILLISHDLHLVMAETDSVLCLNGHVCCRGTPQTIITNPEYLKIFGPRAAEALAVYRHKHDHTHLDDGRIRHLDGSISAGHDDCGHDVGGHDHDHHDGADATEKSRGGHAG